MRTKTISVKLSRTMNMELEDEEDKTTVATTTQTSNAAAAASSSGEFNKGDTVILNGPVYRDSYGNGKGMSFTNRKCTITIKVDTSRPCPYHVDAIGWVKPNTITKA